MDIFEKCRNYTDAREAIASGLYPYFIPLDAKMKEQRWNIKATGLLCAVPTTTAD